MITYKRTNWYGLSYLWRLRGSLLPHCLPTMAMAAVLAGIFSHDLVDDSFDLLTSSLFVDKYSMQLFGVVFGYIAVARLNVSYSRYWEGITHVKGMHSKWADACSQTLVFDRIDDKDEDASRDPFCVHIVRLFMQLSAMATLTLHLENEEIDALWASLEASIPTEETAQASMARAQVQNAAAVVAAWNPRAFAGRPLHEDWLRRVLGRLDSLINHREHSNAASGSFHQQRGRRESALGPIPHTTAAGSNLSLIEYASQALQLEHLFTYREAAHLRGLPDPVLATAHRIYRAVTTRGRTRGWTAPPPIVSRIFQELSNGLLAYNHATKMKEVPVPFAYVQFQGAFGAHAQLARARSSVHRESTRACVHACMRG